MATQDDVRRMALAFPSTSDGYPAVLVRLAAVGSDRLESILEEAWRARAPGSLLKKLGEPAGPRWPGRSTGSVRA
jgi:hypothetical protein